MKNEVHNITDEDLAAYLDGNINEEKLEDILNVMTSDPEIAETIKLSLEVDEILEPVKSGILPISVVAASGDKNLFSFDCETFILEHLDYDIDNWTLLDFAKANNWLRGEGTSLHHVGRILELKGLYVDRKFDASLGDIEKALEKGKQVIIIVDNNLLEKINSETPAFHALYITDVDDDNITYLNLDTLMEESVENEDFLPAWKQSGNYLVTAVKSDYENNP